MVPADVNADIDVLADTAGDDPNSGRSRLLALLATFIVIIVALWLFLSQTAVVPDVIGFTEEDARTALTDSGFVVGQIEPSTAPEVPAGRISSQTPAAGRRTLKGAEIDLTIATGEGEGDGTAGEVPDGGLEEGYDYDFAYQPGSGGSGQVAEGLGTPIDYGPQVPSVQNLAQVDAIAQLRDAGFEPVIGGYGPSTAGVVRGRVYYQSPAPGAYASAGSYVTIWLSTGAPTGGFPYNQPD